jgi:peptidoglycan/xylan/chitin deacetylase (PgdA/CDA1 family)
MYAHTRNPVRQTVSRLLGQLGPDYRLRCLLFHDVAEQPSPFAAGLGVTISPADFEARIRFAAEHYTPVSLEEVLADSPKTRLKKPPVLVTFDDAYVSVVRVAAPILRRYNVPAVMFVTGSLIGNPDLALDNLICYVVHSLGFATLHSVAREVAGHNDPALTSRRQLTLEFLPTLSQAQVAEFRAALVSATGLCTEELAHREQLYMDAEELKSLLASGFEIGNHTYSHVFCRSLRGGDYSREIQGNQEHLERLTGGRVRAFSVPYGSAKDLTGELEAQLRQSKHEAAFLVESRANPRTADPYRFNRVSVQSGSDAEFVAEVEIFPRIRSARDRILAALGKA